MHARQVAVLDSSEDLYRIARADTKRVGAGSTFIERHTEREQISSGVDLFLDVSALLQWSVAPRHLAEDIRRGGERLEAKVPRKTEIDEPAVCGRINNEVIWLHVSVNDVDGVSCNENLRDMQRQPQEIRRSEGPDRQTLAHGVAGDTLFSEPKTISDRGLDHSLVQDPGHTGGLNPHDSEKLASGAVYVRGRVHKLQHHITVVWVQGGENLFLASPRKGLDALEVRKLSREPGLCDLRLSVHSVSAFTP